MDSPRDRLEVLLVRGRAQRSLDPEEAAALCVQAIAVAREVEDARAAIEGLCALAGEYLRFGRADAGAAVARAALDLLDPPAPELWQAEAWSLLGAARRAQGRSEEAAEHALRVIVLARQLGSVMHEATAHNNLGLALHGSGAHDEALLHYVEALNLMEPLEGSEATFLRIVLNSNVADLHSDARDHHRSADYNGVALELLRRIDAPLQVARIGRKRIVSLRRLGRLDEARAQLAEILPVIDGPAIVGGVAAQIRAEAALLDGDSASAADWLRRAMEEERPFATVRRNARHGLDLAAVLPSGSDEAHALTLAAVRCDTPSGAGTAMRCDALELLAVQYETRGDLPAALRCLREAGALQWTLLDQARRRQQAELQARFDVTQRAWEAKFHRTQNEELTRHVDERTRELRAANADLQAARDRAEAADRMKTGFLAAASHELRTPLNAIIGYGELIREELSASDPRELVESTSRLLDSADRLLQLVDRILQMTNLEAGATRIHPGPVPLPALLAGVVRSVERGRVRHGTTLAWSCTPDAELPHTDETLLRSVLFNLVENADKFTTRGEVRVRARREGALLVLAVEDTGIGMNADELTRLFQLFTQIESGFTRRFGGLGLGLALGRRYCQLLGGELTVQSTFGHGSVFEVRIPYDLGRS